MTTTQNIPIELTQPGPPAVLYAAAGDQYSRLAALSLYVEGQPYTPPAGTSCIIGWRRASGTVGSYSQIMDPDGTTRSAWNLSGSVLTIELDWNLCRQAGPVAVNVALVGPDGSRLHTWELLCMVQRGAVADASDPTAPNEAASSAASRAEKAAQQAVQAANLLASAADRAEAAAQRAEAIAPEEGLVLSVNGMGGAVTLDAQAVGAVARPSAPAAGGLLAVDAVDPKTGAVTTRTILIGGGGLETSGGRLHWSGSGGILTNFEAMTSDQSFGSLSIGPHSLQVTASDGDLSTVFTASFEKAAAAASLTLASPICTDGQILSASILVEGSIPDDAAYSVQITNNALDDAPVWQDATQASKAGERITFTNQTAQNGWAFQFKLTVERGSSGTGGYIAAVSGTIRSAAAQ